MVRYRQHTTRWQGPEPGEEVDDAVHEAFNRMRNEMGKQFFPAQWEAFQSYRAWEEGTTHEGVADMPLAAAPSEKEQVIENLEEIRLHLSYDGVQLEFEGYIANLSGGEVVVFFTDIRGEEAHARGVTIQFVIQESRLASEPFPIQFLNENLGKQFSLGIVPSEKPLYLADLVRSLRVQLVEG